MAIVMGAVALAAATGIMNNASKTKALEQQLKQHGIEQAGNEVRSALAQSALVQESSQAAQQEQAAILQVEQQAAEDKAQATVNAAAAGVEGASVDVGLAELDASEGRVKGAVQQQRLNAENQINQKSRDIATGVAMDNQLTPRGGPGEGSEVAMLNIFQSGLSGYLGAR
jgi:hypothetical protein